MDTTDWPQIIGAMRQGGYLDHIQQGGAGLARVAQYLQAFADPPTHLAGKPGQDPAYPMFPGLEHRPFHTAAGHPAVAMLEAACTDIASEALALDDGAHLDYTIASRAVRSWRRPQSWLRRSSPPRAWTVYPFHHMGVCVEDLSGHCPHTLAVIESLPGVCLDYPWGDSLFSVQGPHSRLPAHCSVDNLRLRCHLALRIPAGAGMRVGGETRQWQEGRCLLFEDSFEHDVWNPSDQRRLVLIVDLWHPGLTALEIRALTAGFCKAEVRNVFLQRRISVTDTPGPYLAHIRAVMAAQEQAPAMREFWPA